ncbi:MGMT family protein [Haloparvum sedimenti]|uniref:MGMT family protein n=1 Tax=Haloparvum sedimenti TaxID=1678448 RepID=UPI00071E8322|nr:MGMT family protein [Haloparvum sedimenti]
MVSMGTTGVYARAYDALDRAVEVGFAGGRVISVEFPETVPEDAAADHELLDRIGDYLAGSEEPFAEEPIGLTVPTDRREVLEAARQVPYGEEASVSQVTRMAGLDDNDPEDLDLVTAALGANPVPLLIPDHRVQGGPYATPADVRGTFRRVEGLR